MKAKLLFLGLCFCSISYVSYGQSQSQVLKESTPVVVSSHPDLSAQRTKLDAKQAELNQATTTSKAQWTKLNDELRQLKEGYVRLLRVELDKTTDTTVSIQLQEEISRYSESNLQTR